MKAYVWTTIALWTIALLQDFTKGIEKRTEKSVQQLALEVSIQTGLLTWGLWAVLK